MTDKFRLFRQNWVIGLLLALITCFAYWPVAHFPFVNYDDYDYVVQNAHVNHGLSWNNARWALMSTDASNWHPLTWISHMVDCQFYALKAGGHHVTSLVLHVVNSLLLFGVLQRMTGKRWTSAFVAALFAWHPLHVESVAWVSERKDVLSTCFWLLTMGAYLHYVAKRSFGRYLLVVLFFALGLMSKPMVVTLPFALLLLDYWPLRRIADCGLRLPETANSTPIATKPLPLAQLVLEKVPLFLLSAASSVVTYLVQQQAGAIIVSSDLPLGARAANALVSYCLYLGKAFWPTPLAAPYPHPGAWPSGTVLVSVLFLLIFTAAALVQRRSRPYLMVGWLWFLGVLVPAIGFVQVGGQGMADRYAYIPLIGILIMVAWGMPDLLGQWPQRKWALGLGSATVIAGCLVLTRTQVQYWSDSETLFRHALAVTSKNAMAHTCLGTTLSEKNRTGEAIVEYQKALELEPALGDAHHHLGVALTKQGRTGEAISHLELALKVWPTSPAAHYDLGIALAQEGRTQEAIQEYEKTLQLRPDYPHTHYNLAGELIKQGKLEDAVSHYLAELEIAPGDSAAHNNLGLILARQGKLEEALPHYLQALKDNPDSTETHNNLGYALELQGKPEEARKHYAEALRINPHLAAAEVNLGNLLARQGKTDEALPYYFNALRDQPEYAEAQLRLGLVLGQRGDFKAAAEHLREAVRLRPKDVDACYNLGVVLAEGGNVPEANAQFAKALQLEPGLPERYKKTGASYAQQGNPAAASASFIAALRLKPEDAEARCELAQALEAQDNFEAAVKSYREAIRLAPDSTNALNNLAWILAANSKAELRNGPEAVRLAQHACELTGNAQPMLVGTLAAAYAEAGRFEEAIATAHRAQELALAAGQKELANRNQELLELYRSNRAFHEAPTTSANAPRTEPASAVK